MDNLLFASSSFDGFSADATLPAKFNRLLDRLNLGETVGGKIVAVKMHVGRGIGYSTIHPLFVKDLVSKLYQQGALRVYITDQDTSGGTVRGYTNEMLGCPVVDMCGAAGKYYYEKSVDFKTFKNVDVGGHLADADVLVDLSHVKGHGVCGYGGAVKNIAMGCVTDRTRKQIHSLEGGIEWDADKCNHCGQCIESCNHDANRFNSSGEYSVNYHHCTMCQHCCKVCPAEAITMNANHYKNFQTGMALCTQKCLEHFGGKTIYINFLVNITVICDCWGLTTPNIVPDAGILAGRDIVAIEKASLDMIRVEDLIMNGLPKNHMLGETGHLLERIHGKDPFVQLHELVQLGMGSVDYTLEAVE